MPQPAEPATSPPDLTPTLATAYPDSDAAEGQMGDDSMADQRRDSKKGEGEEDFDPVQDLSQAIEHLLPDPDCEACEEDPINILDKDFPDGSAWGALSQEIVHSGEFLNLDLPKHLKVKLTHNMEHPDRRRGGGREEE